MVRLIARKRSTPCYGLIAVLQPSQVAVDRGPTAHRPRGRGRNAPPGWHRRRCDHSTRYTSPPRWSARRSGRRRPRRAALGCCRIGGTARQLPRARTAPSGETAGRPSPEDASQGQLDDAVRRHRDGRVQRIVAQPGNPLPSRCHSARRPRPRGLAGQRSSTAEPPPRAPAARYSVDLRTRSSVRFVDSTSITIVGTSSPRRRPALC